MQYEVKVIESMYLDDGSNNILSLYYSVTVSDDILISDHSLNGNYHFCNCVFAVHRGIARENYK